MGESKNNNLLASPAASRFSPPALPERATKQIRVLDYAMYYCMYHFFFNVPVRRQIKHEDAQFSNDVKMEPKIVPPNLRVLKQ